MKHFKTFKAKRSATLLKGLSENGFQQRFSEL
jgi:hypothetical protein